MRPHREAVGLGGQNLPLMRLFPEPLPGWRRAARLWLRGARRRARRAVAIVAALTVMAVATTAALVAGDLLEALFLADAEAEWGYVDVEVRAADNSVFEESLVRQLAVEAGGLSVAAASRLLLPATVAAGTEREPGVLLMGVGPEEATFPALVALHGEHEPTLLGPADVLVNERLAGRLDLALGDDVTVWPAVPTWSVDVLGRRDPVVHDAFAPRLTLTVAGVLADVGTADLHRTPNAIMRIDVLQGLAGLENLVTVTHLAAATPDRDGAEALVEDLEPTARWTDLDLTAVAADEIDLADEDGGLFRSILLTLAVVVVASAVTGTLGLLVRLEEERSRELGLLRALGTRTGVAKRLLIAESTTYGMVGALIGGGLGVPVGVAMARGLADHLARVNLDRGREQVELVPQADPWTLLIGAVLIATVAGLAGRSSAQRLLERQPTDLLRGVAPPPSPSTGPGPTVWRVVGWVTLGAGWVTGGPLVFIAVTILLGAWWASARRAVVDRTPLDRRVALAGVAWSVVGAAVLGDFGAGVQAGFGVLTVAGFTAVLCATVIAAGRLTTIMRWVRSYLPTGPLQAALRTAGTWAEQATRRSTTTTATVGGVLFMVAALAVLGSAQALPVERQSGGFDVIATSVSHIDRRTVENLPSVAGAATVPHALLPQTAFAVEAGDGRSRTVPYPVRLAGSTSDFASGQAFGLAAAEEGIESAADALRAVELDRDKAVLDRAALPEGAQVGDEVVIDLGPSPRSFRLIAVLDTYLLNTAFVHPVEMADLADHRGRTMAFIRAAEGVTPADVVNEVEEAAADTGLVARPVEEVREDVIAVNRTFTDVFSIMLVLGLVVALASVASYLARAGWERRAELAVLRAIGLRRRATVTALWAEPLLTGGVGIVIGLSVGLGVLRALFAVGFSDLAFVVDWPRLGVLTVGSFSLLAVVCIGTARLSTDPDIAAGLRDLG